MVAGESGAGHRPGQVIEQHAGIQERQMNDSQAKPGDGPGLIRVWDLPVRLFHWLMAASFAGAYLTSEMDDWRLLHVTFGYTMAALVCFRLAWGYCGTQHARFASFVRGPRATLAYLRTLAHGRAPRFIGHNPAGAVAIVLMLGLTLALAASGWSLYVLDAGGWVEEFHEVAGNLMLALVALHVAGVALASRLHRENLVKAMFTGLKRGRPGEAPQGLRTGAALLLLLLVLGLWWWQGASAPSAALAGAPVAHERAGRGDDD
jgi:cytochrome b